MKDLAMEFTMMNDIVRLYSYYWSSGEVGNSTSELVMKSRRDHLFSYIRSFVEYASWQYNTIQ